MSLAKNVAWMLAGRWAYNLITLASFTTIVALISPAAFGIYTIASTFLILSDTFFSDAVENLIVRQNGEEADIAPTTFWVSVGISGLMAALIAVIAFGFGWFYSSVETQWAIQAIALIIVVQGAASVPRALLMRHGRSRQYATNSALSNLIGAAIGVASAYRGAGFWSLIIQQGALHISMFTLCSIRAGFVPSMRLDRTIAHDFAGHVATMLWSTILNVFGNRLDILVIGALFSNSVTGVYGLAKRLVQILQDLVASSFDKVMLSMIARQGLKGHQERIYRSSVLMQGITAIPSFAGFAAISPLAIKMIFGPEWDGAAALIIMMTVGGIFRSMVTIERAQQMLAGQTRLIANVRLVELIIGVILVVPFGRLGPAYMAVVFSVRYVIGYVLVIASRIGRRETPALLAQTARWLAVPVLATLAMSGIVWLAQRELHGLGHPMLTIAASVMIGVVVFGAILAAARRFWLPYLMQAQEAS
ncbi:MULTISPECIES: oligosaccharide flippase family protein [unclassified Novosphingobium]|uniref:oligosaccharide flippase family protein n=1 Tax=unclassified Novosphingobium TaxID=2644732 RepID=UPI000868CC84|nr:MULTISPECIES: oligosaccharide flippase family protein [unclassified Novosphingobium]ODU68642.1 MAG: hypothetical protein ABT11_15890 [Novosphingobium sp. SCN 66-18]QCI93112.1 hypothetical protein FA702_05790 [Novosphingobium sp. EMRT-2]RQW45492.1 hypothetical protein EH199_04320 [Novosphingobium sp. LASN5T]